jgi:hypothetical protein
MKKDVKKTVTSILQNLTQKYSVKMGSEEISTLKPFILFV